MLFRFIIYKVNFPGGASLIYAWKVGIRVINKSLFNKFLQYKNEKGVSERTLSNYKYGLQNFNKWFIAKYHNDSLNICDITTKDLAEYQNYLVNKNYSLSTISVYRQALLQFLKWCDAIGHNDNAPKFPAAIKIKKIPDVFTKSEYLAFHNAIEKENNLKHKAILFLYLEAGFSLSEALSLKLEKLELFKNKGWANISEGKGKKWGGVPLNYTITLALKEYISKEGIFSGYLFDGRNNKPMSGRNAQLIVNKYVELAAIKRKASPRTLRNTYVINLLKVYPSLPINVLTRLMRKKIFKDLMIYTEPTKSALLDIIEHLNIKDFMNGGTGD